MIEKEIERIVHKLLPEISSGYHLPILAKVIGISDPLRKPGISDKVRPHYAVDIRIVNANGEVDDGFPLYREVPLPVMGAGMERGALAYSEPGTLVEVAFAYGLPTHHFIRTILSEGRSLSEALAGDMVFQSQPGAKLVLTADGNIKVEANGSVSVLADQVQESCVHRSVQADNVEQKVSGHSSEEVIGEKLIQSMSALRLLSGGFMNLTAVEQLNLSAAGSINGVSGKDIALRAAKLFSVIAKEKASVEVEPGGTLWVGDDQVNILKVLSDLIQIVVDLAEFAASHTHPKVGTPTNAGSFNASKQEAHNLKSELDPVVAANEQEAAQ